MRDCIYEGIRLRYYEPGDKLGGLTEEKDYVIAKACPEDVGRIKELEERGFCFHNRTVLGEIPLSVLNEKQLRMIRADVREEGNITPDLYELARRCFPRDRRFHLKKDFDQGLADKILKGYMDELSGERLRVYKCFHKSRLTGFTIVKNLENQNCENVLGAVDPEYQNRGAALNLYLYMMKCLRDNGMEKLYGRISTTNMASINLHIALGAKYREPMDEYIHVRNGILDKI